jgi:AcrR family transcriptional regulator
MSSTAKKVDQRVARGEATRMQILKAARDVLRKRGHAAMSTRVVAERAGVPLSLVHYHFGGRRNVLAALLEHENERLLVRQRAMYAGPEPLAEKWRTACAYLRQDLRSGYVRILWELWAAGLADEELARRWRDAVDKWRSLLETVAAQWAAERDVELPMPPRALATLVVNLFQGAEAEILTGVEAPHLDALEACASLIERVEKRALGPASP